MVINYDDNCRKNASKGRMMQARLSPYKYTRVYKICNIVTADRYAFSDVRARRDSDKGIIYRFEWRNNVTTYILYSGTVRWLVYYYRE